MTARTMAAWRVLGFRVRKGAKACGVVDASAAFDGVFVPDAGELLFDANDVYRPAERGYFDRSDVCHGDFDDEGFWGDWHDACDGTFW